MAETKYCYRHPDRETGLSCSDCGRPICVDCMTVAPVGIRCPDHAGAKPRQAPGPVRTVQRAGARRGLVITGDAIVTKILVAANVIVYLITVAQGAGINKPDGEVFRDGALLGCAPDFTGECYMGVAAGDWWRLITSTFLHAGIFHIALNMLALYWLGGPIENVLGRARYLLLYVVSGLAGSAGALIVNPDSYTVGASGAIFGMLGAGLILEYRATGSLAGQYMSMIVLNLLITLFVPGISIGGHIGGLVGGALGVLALTAIPRRAFPRAELAGIAGLVAIGVLSIVVAYWQAGTPA